MIELKLEENKEQFKCRLGHGDIKEILTIKVDGFDEKDATMYNGPYCPLCIIERLKTVLGIPKLSNKRITGLI